MTKTWMAPHLKYDSLGWDDVAVGDALPNYERHVDTTLVVAGALASGDFYPVHHDLEAAKKAGAPDVFLNILTTNGLMSAYVTNWSGPAWELTGVDLRLVIPAFPGQTLAYKGEVTGKDDATRTIVVEFSAETAYGVHCKGTARLVLADAS